MYLKAKITATKTQKNVFANFDQVRICKIEHKTDKPLKKKKINCTLSKIIPSALKLDH